MANESDDPYVAYCLDDACYMWGRIVERELSDATANCSSDNMRRLAIHMAYRRLFEDRDDKSKPTKFADPAVAFRKVQTPTEDGEVSFSTS